jgi:hypothetical protein
MAVTFAAQSTPRNDPLAGFAKSITCAGWRKKSGPENFRGRFEQTVLRFIP